MFFFLVFIVPLKPNRFGSVGVLPVSGFVNRNRTEPKILTKKIIGLISFFFGSVFLVVFFSVYSIFQFFCSSLLKSYLDKHFEKKKLFLTWDKLYFFYSIHSIPTKQERYEAEKKTKCGQTISR